MATVHFTGTGYRGFDGAASLHLSQPGTYEVSDSKAAQLVADFPYEFALAAEQEPSQAKSTPAKAPENDPASEKVEAPKKDAKAPSSPAKKAS